MAFKANVGRAAHRSEMSDQLKQAKADRKPTSGAGPSSPTRRNSTEELAQLELDGTDNWMLYSQACKRDQVALSARGNAPKVDASHVSTLISTLGLIPSSALGHPPETRSYGDRLVEGSAGGHLVPCNRRGHWFPFKVLKHAAVDVLGPLRPPGVKGTKGLEAYAQEASLQALERLGHEVFDFYSRVGFFGAWCELAPRGADGRPLSVSSNTAADSRVYALRRAVVLGVGWTGGEAHTARPPQPPALFAAAVGAHANPRAADEDLRLLLARLASLCDVAAPRLLEALARFGETPGHVRPGEEIVGAAAASPKPAALVEMLPLLRDTLHVYGIGFDPLGWMAPHPNFGKLGARLEQASRKWAQAELRRLERYTKQMKEWNLSRLLAAIVLARGGDIQGEEASVFAVEWSRVRLDDLPGFPDWMPQLQALLWTHFKAIQFVFRAYASSGAVGGANQAALNLGLQEFGAFVKDANLRSKALNTAKVDLLYTGVKSRYKDMAEGGAATGITELCAFIDALVRLSLARAEERPVPPECKMTTPEKGKKAKPILLPGCIEEVLTKHLAAAADEASRLNDASHSEGDAAAAQAVLQEHDASLQAIFRFYCTVDLAAYRKRGGSSKLKDGGGGSGGGGSPLGSLVGSPGGDDGEKPVDVSHMTIDLQEWLTFLTDANALGSAGNLNEKQATTIFTRADLADDDIGAAAGGGPEQGGNDAAEALTFEEFSDAVARAALQYTKGIKEFGSTAAARVRAFLSMVMASPAALCLKKPKRPSTSPGAASEPSAAADSGAESGPASPDAASPGGGVPAAPTPGPALARELEAAGVPHGGVPSSRRAGVGGATRH